MGDAGCIDGEITSTTEHGAEPGIDGQSNFGAVGSCCTLDSGDGFIMVSVDGEWYCFYEEPQEAALTGRCCAYLRRIYGEAIYVDLAEYITDEDTERIRELGLTENSDMPDSYYIHNPEVDDTALYLDGDTVYSFIDWNRDFVGESAQDNRFVTTMKTDFLEYLNTYKDSRPGMPFFFTVENGVVREIYEEPMA